MIVGRGSHHLFLDGDDDKLSSNRWYREDLIMPLILNNVEEEELLCGLGPFYTVKNGSIYAFLANEEGIGVEESFNQENPNFLNVLHSHVILPEAINFANQMRMSSNVGMLPPKPPDIQTSEAQTGIELVNTCSSNTEDVLLTKVCSSRNACDESQF
ncbi:hypothetical protein RIF29_12686 [Crotalaria pallida]|uniref:Uncharacterized protein n=1 Tax=Crotalaria pallida TaxID=3830 RepID=A0AAN9INM5_CROPI